MQYIPNEIVSELDESMLEILRQPCKAVTDDANTNELSLANETDYKPEDIDFETLIISLIASSDEGTKWMQVSFECFKQCFANAETIKKILYISRIESNCRCYRDFGVIFKDVETSISKLSVQAIWRWVQYIFC